MSWTSIPASVYAVGKPITSVSYGYLKDNIEGHDHVAGRGATIGTDGVNQNSIAASAVGQNELNIATGSWSGSIDFGSDIYISTHAWGHTPFVGSSNQANINWSYDNNNSSGINTTNEVVMAKGHNTSGSVSRTGHIKWNYHII